MVISMLTIGGFLLIAFVVWEWKIAKLPMMPSMLELSELLFNDANQAQSTFIPTV